jgi:hypothetical protein
MRGATRAATGRAALIIVPGGVLLTLLVFIGVLTEWPAAVLAVVWVVGAAVFSYIIAASRTRFDIRRPWLQYGQAAVAVLLAACSVVVAAKTYQQWIRTPEQHQREVQQVGAEARTVASLLTTITDGDREHYLQRLRPHVTDEVLTALKTNVVGLLPTGRFTQKGVVTSVAVEVVRGDGATAIAVVQPTPRPAPTSVDGDPDDIILFLLLAKYQNRWAVANLAPLGVRPAYAH